MATVATVRDNVIRIPAEDFGAHLATLEQELSDSRAIELVRGDKVIAELRAPAAPVRVPVRDSPPVMPDFMGRMKAVFGDEVLPAGFMTRVIRKDRDGRG